VIALGISVALAVAAAEPDAVGLTGASDSPANIGPAEAFFQRGVAAYDARDYSQAIQAFKAAYAASKAPAILFDLGQTFRSLGNCASARDSFDAFAAAVRQDDPLLPRARARSQEMSLCAEAAIATLVPSAARVSAAPDPSLGSLGAAGAADLRLSATASDPRLPRNRWGTACASTIGGALTLVLAGTAFGWSARSLAQTVEGRSAWDAEAQRLDDRGRAFGDAATVTLLAAGVVAAAGVAVCGVAWNTRASR
jgi:tetratricopeptide (TPR) repeat protein